MMSPLQDQQCGATVLPAQCGLLQQLGDRLSALLEQTRTQTFYRVLADPASDSRLVRLFMREVFRDVYTYQKRIDEAIFMAVGRFGKTVDEQELVRSMIAVQNEEVGHGMIALSDYAALGGDANWLKDARPTPHALAVISVVTELGFRQHPLSHLGYLFFLERFTTLITHEVAPMLSAHGYPDDRLIFMRLHAEEDIRHADMTARVIEAVVERYADAEEAIRFGFDSFETVYPLDMWNAAFARAQQFAEGAAR